MSVSSMSSTTANFLDSAFYKKLDVYYFYGKKVLRAQSLFDCGVFHCNCKAANKMQYECTLTKRGKLGALRGHCE